MPPLDERYVPLGNDGYPDDFTYFNNESKQLLRPVYGSSALKRAIQCVDEDNLPFLKQILNKNLIHATDTSGNSIVKAAVTKGRKSILKFLRMQYGLNVDRQLNHFLPQSEILRLKSI
jgi:hypothetical protein